MIWGFSFLSTVLQNATTNPNPSALLVYNINYTLLYLDLSGLYMIKAGRKVLFSTRIRDLESLGNILHYVAIGVGQAIFMTLIQTILEQTIHIKFIDLGMTLVLFIALVIESAHIANM